MEQNQSPSSISKEESFDRSNLIVNYLPSSLMEDSLRSLFSPYGELETCKIMRDKFTLQSLGYGFVKYREIESADNAVKTLNGFHIEDKVMKVAPARPSSTGIQHANLYVGDLEPSVTKEQVDAVFHPYGTIIDSKILYDKTTGQSRGIGFVRFDTRAQAESAISNLNGTVFSGTSRPMTVKLADHSADKLKKGKAPPFGGTGQNIAMVAGGMYGPSNHSRYSIPYSQPQAVTPNSLDMSSALSQGQQFCLFVYQLPPETDENLLYRLFGPFGAITAVKVVREPSTGNCKGFAFVNFLKLEDAHQAIIGLNGYLLTNKPLQVSFKKNTKS